MKKYSSYIIIAMIFIIILFFGNYITKYNYYEQNLQEILLSPFEKGHILGTDSLGRDLYKRLLNATFNSLLIAICVSFLSCFFGFIYGSICGYSQYDYILIKLLTLVNSIPNILYSIIILIFFDNNILSIILALFSTRWISYALLTRNNTKKLKKQEFIVSSYLMGANFWYIMKKHLFKNNLYLLLNKISLDIPSIIFAESFLSFAGLGIKIPKASLGSMVFAGIGDFYFSPYPFIFPTIIIFCISIFFYFLSIKLGENSYGQDIRNK